MGNFTHTRIACVTWVTSYVYGVLRVWQNYMILIWCIACVTWMTWYVMLLTLDIRRVIHTTHPSCHTCNTRMSHDSIGGGVVHMTRLILLIPISHLAQLLVAQFTPSHHTCNTRMSHDSFVCKRATCHWAKINGRHVIERTWLIGMSKISHVIHTTPPPIYTRHGSFASVTWLMCHARNRCVIEGGLHVWHGGVCGEFESVSYTYDASFARYVTQWHLCHTSLTFMT